MDDQAPSGREAGFSRRDLLAQSARWAALTLLPSLPLAPPAAALAAPPDRALAELDRLLRGPLFRPGSPGYESGRLPYNARYDGIRPLAVARPADARDVRQILRWSGRTGIPVAARSGGHSYAGYSTTRGVVVDLSVFSGVALDRTGAATVGAGARLVDVYARLAARGRGLAAGSCPTVGIGGLTLGGGFGLASRAWGLTCDQLVRLELVRPDGELRTCDRSRNADLFWACRGGGGGNFGIVTRFVFRTHAVSRGSWFVASWPWSEVERVVARFQAWAPSAPDALGIICRLATGSPTPSVEIFGQYLGGETALGELVARLASGLPQPRVRSGNETWLELQQRWAGCLGEPLAECAEYRPSRFAAASGYVTRPLPAPGLAALRQAIEERQGSSGAVLLDAYGGAVGRVAPGATAFVHRDALYSCQYFSSWSSAADDAAGQAWVDGFRDRMRPFTSGAYQNYIDPHLAGWKHAYYGRNLPRLAAVKRKYDPHGVLRFPQAVPRTA